MGKDSKIFEELKMTEPRSSLRVVGRPSESYLVRSQGSAERVIPSSMAPQVSRELIENLNPRPTLRPQSIKFQVQGLPEGYESLNVHFAYSSSSGYLNAGTVSVRIKENSPVYANGDNAVVIPGGMSWITSIPVFVESEEAWYAIKPLALTEAEEYDIEFIPVGGGVVGESRKPFDIVNLRGDGEPNSEGKFSTYKAEVWPGTVAGIMPNNIFNNGALATFTVGSGLQKWKCKCLTDGRQITSVQIVVDPSDPPMQVLVPSALPAEAWFIFGLTFEGKSYRTLGPGNPLAQAGLPLITDKTTPPPPGIPGVDRWYQLFFS